MLIEELKVTLADLLPEKGVMLTVAGETTPYRISERLHGAIKQAAEQRGVPIARVFVDLRDEVWANS